MKQDENLDPRLKQALDDRDDEQARKILFVLLTTYAADARKMAWLTENWRSAPMN